MEGKTEEKPREVTIETMDKIFEEMRDQLGLVVTGMISCYTVNDCTHQGYVDLRKDVTSDMLSYASNVIPQCKGVLQDAKNYLSTFEGMFSKFETFQSCIGVITSEFCRLAAEFMVLESVHCDLVRVEQGREIKATKLTLSLAASEKEETKKLEELNKELEKCIAHRDRLKIAALFSIICPPAAAIIGGFAIASVAEVEGAIEKSNAQMVQLRSINKACSSCQVLVAAIRCYLKTLSDLGSVFGWISSELNAMSFETNMAERHKLEKAIHQRIIDKVKGVLQACTNCITFMPIAAAKIKSLEEEIKGKPGWVGPWMEKHEIRQREMGECIEKRKEEAFAKLKDGTLKTVKDILGGISTFLPTILPLAA